jgi:hypothetical protein|tara:strand:+ start:1261 stop:1887 length:627 start_codon:yes stop_codon:yes gene_type:complete
MIKKIPGLSFFPEWHRYRYKAEWLARSVTGVLGAKLAPEALANIMRYKDGPDGWAARGEQVHGALESYLKGEQLEFAERWADWVDPIIECELFKDAQVIATEYRLCDAKKSIGGSFDFLLKTSTGEIVLGDLKTVGSKSRARNREPATEQLGAYLAMLIDHHPALHVDKCVTVVSGPKECRVIRQNPDECVEPWLDSWDRYQFELEDW